NPSFGEIDHPEPIDDYLPQLISKVKAGNYDLGIATDGDADRVGLIDSDGNFVDSHRLFMILLKYLNEIKGAHGSVVKTVSLTSMVNAYCADKGLELHETPVGFKHTAKIMSEEDVMIGGEESGGLGTYLHIPERDGIFNALMVLEVMVKRDMSLKQLCDELDEQFGTHRYRRRDVKVTPETKEQIMNAAGKKPTKLGKYEVKEIITKDGYKFMVDKGWLLIRASGTEPLIRFYAEAENLDKVNELLDAGLTLK
ncbi:MAG: phosphoglucomutase/phosphomannomutase family protein, partial [Bacteroidota bacterium]